MPPLGEDEKYVWRIEQTIVLEVASSDFEVATAQKTYAEYLNIEESMVAIDVLVDAVSRSRRLSEATTSIKVTTLSETAEAHESALATAKLFASSYATAAAALGVSVSTVVAVDAPYVPRPTLVAGGDNADGDDDPSINVVQNLGNERMDDGAMAASIVLPILFLLFVVFACIYWRKNRARKQKDRSESIKALPVGVTSSTDAETDAPLTSIAIASGTEETHNVTTSPRTKLAESRVGKIESDDPEAEHKEVKARLREYEVAFVAREGRKPKKRTEWGEMWPDYQRYAALRKMLVDKQESGATIASLQSFGGSVEESIGAPEAGTSAAGASTEVAPDSAAAAPAPAPEALQADAPTADAEVAEAPLPQPDEPNGAERV